MVFSLCANTSVSVLDRALEKKNPQEICGSHICGEIFIYAIRTHTHIYIEREHKRGREREWDFKELTLVVVRAGKSEICGGRRASQELW